MSAQAATVKEAERARGTKLAAKRAPRGRTREIAEAAKSESPTAAAVSAITLPSVAATEEALSAGEEAGGLAAVGLVDDTEEGPEATDEVATDEPATAEAATAEAATAEAATDEPATDEPATDEDTTPES